MIIFDLFFYFILSFLSYQFPWMSIFSIPFLCYRNINYIWEKPYYIIVSYHFIFFFGFLFPIVCWCFFYQNSRIIIFIYFFILSSIVLIIIFMIAFLIKKIICFFNK